MKPLLFLEFHHVVHQLYSDRRTALQQDFVLHLQSLHVYHIQLQ